MPCCAILILLFLGPRIAIVLFALFSTFFRGYDSLLIPVLGFIFMPWTLLAYTWSVNATGGVSGIYLLIVIVAALVDLGVIGGGATRRRQID